MATEILIIGLQEVGASLGLALAQSELPLDISGYDKDKPTAKRAHEAGAFQRQVLDPRRAARGVDVVIRTATPADATDYLQELAPQLSGDTVMLDMTTPSLEALERAQEASAKGGHIISALPVVRFDALHHAAVDPHLARPDLFEGGMIGLALPPELPEPSTEVILSLCGAVGATAFFIDPAELEYVSTVVEWLPALLGAGLLRASASTAGWPNIQRLAGRTFAASTHKAALHPAEALADHLLSRRTTLMALLATFSEELNWLRQALEAEDRTTLIELLDEGMSARAQWLRARELGDWQSLESPHTPIPHRGILNTLLGFGPRPQPGGDQPKGDADRS